MDQIEFNALSDCDKWRYYRDASDQSDKFDEQHQHQHYINTKQADRLSILEKVLEAAGGILWDIEVLGLEINTDKLKYYIAAAKGET